MTTKVCTRCETEKPLEAFRLIRTNKNGTILHCAQCMECKNKYSRERYQSFSSEKRTEIYQKKVEGTTFEDRKDDRLSRRYGISLDDFSRMLEEQNNSCWICEIEFPATRSIKVDHCHDSGNVRGLLCHLCNTGLGSFQDQTVRLNRAVEYLRLHCS